MVQSLGPRMEEVVRQLLPGGTKVGHEWKCGDVSGAPGTSLTVELDGEKAGLWCDQAASEGGDLIDLIAATQMLSTGKAIAWLRNYLGIKSDKDERPFDPLNVGFKRQGDAVWRKGSKAWTYRDAAGNAIAWVVRFDREGGKKDVLPLRMIDGKPKWKGFTKDEKKPIYNLHTLTRRPDAPIIIVEGEKTADAAATLFPDHVAITWMGGVKNVAFVDWSPITEAAKRGVEIILWPDADNPGREAMTYLKAILPTAHLVHTPGLPDGWDLADPAPEGVSIRGLLDAAKHGNNEASAEQIIAAPFRPVGHTEDGYLYHSHLTGYLVCLSAAEHTEMNLQRLAPDSYWLTKGFVDDKSMAVDYKAVAKHLIAVCHQLGTFDTSRVRGRGCWIEPGNRVVYHAGNRLLVDGKEVPIADYRSDWIYPARKRIDIDITRPADTAAGRKFVRLCELLPWAPGTWGWILPAALYLAPICGALNWRPQLWLIGAPNSGKSWTCREIISPMLGDACIKALSSTTSPGLRQAIGPDAIPVTGDEFEAKDEKTRARIASILELVRQATAETGWSIYHGTTEGTAKAYQTRSMFIFSSIIAGALDPADMGRFAIIEFHRRESREDFDALCDALHQTIGQPGFCESIRARAITRAPQIIADIAVFQRAVARAARDSRKGDTFGTYAAALWSLENDRPVTQAEAESWANSVQWDDMGSGDETVDSDPSRVLDLLLQHRSFIQNSSGHREDLTVGEMLDIYRDPSLPSDPRAPFCYEALMRLGLHPIDDELDVAVRHPELQRIFKPTPYADHWADHLRRPPINAANSIFKLPGGSRVTRSVRLKMAI